MYTRLYFLNVSIIVEYFAASPLGFGVAVLQADNFVFVGCEISFLSAPVLYIFSLSLSGCFLDSSNLISNFSRGKIM